MPDPLDLATVSQVKEYPGSPITSSGNDEIIQRMLTAFSKYVHRRTGRKNLASLAAYTEYYSGRGTERLFLNQTPVVSITSLQVGARNIPIGTDFTIGGAFVEDNGKSVVYTGPYGQCCHVFCQGVRNIKVVYEAGYDGVPEDLQEAVIEAVATNFKRRSTLDLATITVSVQNGNQVTSYRSWEVSPKVAATIQAYTRVAI